MSKKNTALVPLFACSLVLVMGALNNQPYSAAQSAGPLFLARPVALAAGLGDLAPAQILQRAVACLAPDKMTWLRVTTWQKQTDEDTSFEAEGRLVRGPNHCVRLEMSVRSGGEATQIVIVSDGVGVARACRPPNRAIDVSTEKFMTPDKQAMTGERIEEVLDKKGCGGPHGLLKDLERGLTTLTMQCGTWKDRPVLRLTGTPTNSRPFPEGEFGMPVRFCRLYLNPQSLWPERVEWWGSREVDDPPMLLLEMEYRAPQTNNPLSHEDCVREFTYQPEG